MFATDAIFIRRLAVDTVIGILDWEREQTQTLYLSLTLNTNTRKAAASESVTDTIDYSAVADLIADHLQANSYQLLETLASRVCELLLERFDGVQAVSLSVEKPDAVPGCESLGVRVQRERG